MSVALDIEEFNAELPGWLLRGALCAGSSFLWAYQNGFTASSEFAGMVVGILFWVTVFSIATAWRPGAITGIWLNCRRALKVAAWIKAGLSVLGIPALVASFAPAAADWFLPFVLATCFDMWLGVFALGITCWIGGFRDFEQIAKLDSVAWTALATIIEGALMAAVIVLLAVVVYGVSRWLRTSGPFPSAGSNQPEVVRPPGLSSPR